MTYPHFCAGALLSSPPLEFTAQANAIDTLVGTPDTIKTQYSTVTICTQQSCLPVSVPAVNGARGKHKICQGRPYLQAQIPQGVGQRQWESTDTPGTYNTPWKHKSSRYWQVAFVLNNKATATLSQ